MNPLPKCWNFKDDCVPNGSTGKVAAWGGSYFFMIYDVFFERKILLENQQKLHYLQNKQKLHYLRYQAICRFFLRNKADQV